MDDLSADTPASPGVPAKPAQADLPEGSTSLGGYRVLRKIGAGGMGVVYLARDEVLGRRVAVKLLSRTLFRDPAHVERFLVEARMLARFNHPSIVTVYSGGDEGGLPYLAMEYVEGKTLRGRMREEPLRIAEIQRLALDIATALQEAHGQHVVHGDLKPENVILGRGGRPRVVDFGLSRMVSGARRDAVAQSPPEGAAPDDDSGPAAVEQRATEYVPLCDRSGSLSTGAGTGNAVQGTAPYLAPEQWNGDPGDTAVDIWALGVMMYELLCGKHPYHDARSRKVLRQRVTGQQPVPRVETRRDVPQQLGAAVDGCLVKDPSCRTTADELVDVLTRLVHATGGGGAALQECPFRGLEAFSERHARYFFGRTEEVESFLERLRAQPVLPVIGASGVGKSSFVQAGVIPRLRELDEWSVIRMRPGTDPFGVLARTLHTAETTLASAPSEGASTGATQALLGEEETEAALAAELFEQPKRLASLLAERARVENVRVLLLVDQMEEVVTMAADAEVRDRFLEAVCGAADDQHEPVRVVFTTRDDFLSRLAQNRAMRRALESVTVLQSPGAEALHEIMTMPLRTVGYDYDDPALPAAMVEAVGGETSALPLLQFTASLLWDRRDQHSKRLLRSDYDAIGGVQGALASHADAALQQLDVDDVRVVRGAMLRLVTPEGTRRTVQQQEMVESLGPRAEHVLKRLSDARLLSVQSDQSGVQFELSHESLVHTWERLRRWLDEGRDESVFVGELSQAASLWAQRGRRRAETWTGEALAGALRNVDRYGLHLTSTAQAFLRASRQAERARRRVRKALVAGAFALMGLVAVVAIVKERETDRQRREAVKQKQAAAEQRARADIEGARSALLVGNPLEARGRLRRSLETADSPLARTLWRELSYEPLLWRHELGGVVSAVAMTPQGKRVIAAEYSGLISVFDADTAALHVGLRGQSGPIYAIAASADGRFVAYGNKSGEVGLWDLSTETVRRSTGHEGEVIRVRFGRSGRDEVISAGMDGRALVWRTDAWTAHPLGEPGRPIKGLAVGPSGQVALGRADGTLELWSSTSATEPRTLRLSSQSIESVAFGPIGSDDLAVGLNDGEVALIDLNSGEARRRLRAHTAFVKGVRFSSDGRRLYSAAFDRRLLVWDTQTGQLLASFDGHEGGIYGLDLSGDDRRMVSGSGDQTVRLWDASLLARSAKPAGHRGPVTGVAATADGELLVTVGYDHTVRVWSSASGEELALGRGHDDVSFRVAISPDGRRAASSSTDGSARIWSLPSAKPQRVLLGHEGFVYGVAFIDNDHVVTTGWDGTVRLWRLEDGACTRILKSGFPSLAVAVSSDGALMAVGGLNGAVRLWRKPFRGAGVTRDFGTRTVYGLAFAPDRSAVAAATAGAVLVWNDIRRSEPPEVLERSEHKAYNVAFDPSATHVAVGYKNHRLLLWELASGRHRAFEGHMESVNAVLFSPDGNLLASTSGDGTVRTWRVDTTTPSWRTGVLLGPPYDGALTHRGWVGAAVGDDGAQWRQAVERAPSVSRQLGQSACIPTPSGGVQRWSLQQDVVRAEAADLRAVSLRALVQGCLVVDDQARGWLLADRSPPTELAADVRAVGWDPERLLLATGERVVELDAGGDVRRQAAAPPLVTAVGAIDEKLIYGYGDGSVELRSWDGEDRQPLRDTGHGSVIFLAEGPAGTVMVGYGDGLFGLWTRDNGTRLLSEKLHGPIVDVRRVGSMVRVASALGDVREIDLSALDVPYCELLSKVWGTIPVSWRGGVPVAQPPPESGRCRGPGPPSAPADGAD